MEEEINSRFIFFSPLGLLLLLLIIIIGNLFIIDIALFYNKPNKKESIIASTNNNKIQTPTPSPSPTCNTDCKNEIKKAVNEALLTQKINSKSNTTSSTVKEFFIPLGSGSSTDIEWTDIPGAQSYVDNNSYVRIKSVTFEASLHTPTGNQTANARLYNVTDQHPVWNSEVSIDGGSPQLKISSPIALDNGSKLYQVQMRTQLGARTNLENARIHINTQ